jgi:hypothetical protein
MTEQFKPEIHVNPAGLIGVSGNDLLVWHSKENWMKILEKIQNSVLIHEWRFYPPSGMSICDNCGQEEKPSYIEKHKDDICSRRL